MIIYSSAELKQKAAAEKVPFSQMLGWYMYSCAAEAVAESAFGSCLWLIYPHSFLASQDRHMFENGLDYYYKEDEKITPRDGFVAGQKLTIGLTQIIFSKVLRSIESAGLNIKGIPDEINSQGSYSIKFHIEYEKMYFPMQLRIRKTSENVFPEKASLKLVSSDTPVDILRYPKELDAADNVYYIMKQLELANDMDRYLMFYDELSEESIDGREVSERLSQLLQSDGRTAEGSRLERFLSYRDSRVMQKKWKSVLKRHKLQSPIWTEAHEKMSNFIKPVWESLVVNQVFLGDWMPQLGRFLD